MKYKLINSLKNFIVRSKKHDISGHSAKMSYYLILSFFPFLIFLITAFSYTELFQTTLITTLKTILPTNTYNLVFENLNDLLESKSSSLLSFSMMFTIFFASKGITSIIEGINLSYEILETRGIIKRMLISIFFTVLLAFTVNVLFVFVVFGSAIAENLFTYLGIAEIYTHVWHLLRYVLSLGFVFLVFSSIYIFFPDMTPKPKFNEVYWGSLFSTIMSILTSLAFAFYVNNFSRYNLVYGSIAGIIVLLTWLYMISLIILVGGEINALSKEKQN